MNSSNLRYGGIAAIAAALLYLISLVFWMSADPEGAPPPLATAAYMASTLFFLVTLYALYLFHRSEAAGLSLATVLLLGSSMVVSLFIDIDPTDLASPLVLLATIAYGLGALGLGWLAYRSDRMPRGLAWLPLIMGVLTLSMVGFIPGGSADIVGILNLIVGVLYIVWLLWLGRSIMKQQGAPLRAV